MTTIRRINTGSVATSQLRAIALNTLASWLLAAAFVVSTGYQLYRSTQMELPADAFDLPIVVVYGTAIALSLLVGRLRHWGKWLALSISLVFTLIGLVYYLPVLTPQRTFGLIDWAETVVYLGLLFTAGVVSICDIAGLTLLAGREKP